MEAARLRALTGQLHKIHRIHTLSNDKIYGDVPELSSVTSPYAFTGFQQAFPE